MNLERPLVVRAVMAAAAVILVIGLIGLFTVDSDDNDTLAASERTTTTVGDSESTTTSVLEGPTTTATSVATATTKALSPTTIAGSAQVPDPGATKPPTPGTYVYKFTSEADPTANGDTESKIEALPGENGAVRRRQTYKDGEGNTLSNDETWASDTMSVSASHIVSPQATVDCTWKPPLLIFQLPLAIGKTWTSDSTCTTMVQGTQVTIRRKSQSKVTGKFLEKVGSASVPTWVIESTGTTSVKNAFFNTDATEKITRRFASAKGLLTYEKGDISVNGHASSYERVLQSMTPK